MIEEVSKEENLFKLVREEGTIIKQGNYYWIYANDYYECEQCGREVSSHGWNNITNIVIEAKKEVFDVLDKVRVGEHSYPKNICFKKTVYNQIKKRCLSTLPKEEK